jgi:DNA-directed RNA polymerase specialized sigma24 family protein
LDTADELSGVDPIFTDDEAAELVALDAALGRLQDFNPRGADVVQYRFFGGLVHQEIAEVTGVSEVTVRRRWAAAKAWLRAELDPAGLDRTETVLTGARGS